MDRSRVRYFLAVCKHGGFKAAAKACGVSQPSVTMGVRRFERDLGGKLFERAHPVGLTPLGAKLLPLLKEMQSSRDRITAVLDECGGGAATPNGGRLLGRSGVPPARSSPDGDGSRIEVPNGPSRLLGEAGALIAGLYAASSRLAEASSLIKSARFSPVLVRLDESSRLAINKAERAVAAFEQTMGPPGHAGPVDACAREHGG